MKSSSATRVEEVMRLHDRARGCLMGLAVGDALGRPAEGMSPAAIAARWGRITDFVTDQPAGSDDTEYALFYARLLLRHGIGLTSTHVAEAWRRDICSQTGGFKGAGFSEMATIENLRAGLEPPASGQHCHSWSDGLAMRAAPSGIFAAGDPALAAHLTAVDGAVSHSGEGIYAGQAVAAGVAVAMAGATPEEVWEAALAHVPADSWTARALRTAGAIGLTAPAPWSALEPLYEALALTYYHWTDLAPEAVGFAFGAYLAARGRFVDAVLAGVNCGRDADTIAAMAGALAGATGGLEAVPARWAAAITAVKGTCIRTVAGLHVLEMADALADAALARREGR